MLTMNGIFPISFTKSLIFQDALNSAEFSNISQILKTWQTSFNFKSLVFVGEMGGYISKRLQAWWMFLMNLIPLKYYYLKIVIKVVFGYKKVSHL